MLVNGIDVLEELIAVFYLLDDKNVIHIPTPKPGWRGSSTDGLWLKLLHEQVSYYRIDRTHGCTMDLFKILTLKEKVGIFEEKL